MQSRNYKRAGRFPVIDQGQSEIAGWTDDESAVIRGPLPVVVFGDHTRALKYIDFPFARGADGTQIIRPKEGIDVLYFYYACRALELPGRGYNRHFSLLKEKSIALPPRDEQVAIARVLRLTDDAIAIEGRLIDCASALKKTAMAELFARGLRGEPQKETEIGPIPNSWMLKPFREVATIAEGQVDPRAEPYFSLVHVGPENIDSGSGELLQCKTAGELNLISGKYYFEPGDIVYSKIRPYLRKVVLAGFEGICSADMYPIRARSSVIDAYYLFSFLLSDYFTNQALRYQARTGIPKLNREQLNALVVPVPPLEEQLGIAAAVHALDDKRRLHRRTKAVLEELFRALLCGLVSGEIRARDLYLRALETTSDSAAATVEVVV